MKRLLILSIVALAAGSAGCKHCSWCGGGGGTTAYRPCTPAPTCCPPSDGTVMAAPGEITTPGFAPAPSLPLQSYPGPEAYTPAN